MAKANKKQVLLTHFGRKTGKAYVVPVWFAEVDGELWVGSLDRNRNWVRNVRATGRARLDFGSGPLDYECTWQRDPEAIAAFRRAIRAKYPVASLLIALFQRGKEGGAFKLTRAAEAD